jgi:DNA-binding transcriptional regulator YiaG
MEDQVMDDNNTGTLIRELRLRLKMTQEEFAHSLGITVSTVNRWENGHSEPSKLARASIVGLAEKRGVTIDANSLTIPQEPVTTSSIEAYAR